MSLINIENKNGDKTMRFGMPIITENVVDLYCFLLLVVNTFCTNCNGKKLAVILRLN